MHPSWFPNSKIHKSLDFVFDSVQNDFDEQAALFSGIDQTYTQLTGGKFEGRLFSADLGPVAIYIEYCNQAIEKEISTSPNEFSFSLALEGQSPSSTYGVMESTDLVYVLPPSGRAVTISPPNGIVMVITADCDALLESGLLLKDVAQRLAELDKQGEFLKSPRLAERLRSDAFSALEAAPQAKSPEMRAKVAELMIFALATAFTVEWLKLDDLMTFQRTAAYERYLQTRSLLRGGPRAMDKSTGEHAESLGSKRSIELAFSKLVSMGPLKYSRVARLHNARRKLMDKQRLTKNIGDIAAEEGFWDWSKFSTYYQKQFGELPSDTRGRIASGRSRTLRKAQNSVALSERLPSLATG